MHDMTVFHGGKVEDKKENWNQKALYFQIKWGDWIVRNNGYEGKPSKIVVMRDKNSEEFKIFLARVASQQETFSKGLKDWKFFKDRFAFGNNTKERMKLHKMAVKAIAVIHQYDYENGHPSFEVCWERIGSKYYRRVVVVLWHVKANRQEVWVILGYGSR